MKRLLLSFLMTLSFAVPVVAFAQPATTDTSVAPIIRTPTEYGYVNPLGTTNVRTIINRVIRTAIGFVGALFLAMFVYGGALWMTAAGDEKKVQSAKTTIRNAVFGMLVIALSYGLISIIFEVAGQVRGDGPPISFPSGERCSVSSDCSDALSVCEGGVCVSVTR